MEDVLGDILRHLRLKGCVYFGHSFNAPWAMEIPGTPFVQFHAVVSGSCTLEYDGHINQLNAGDVALFPHGQPHILADRPGRDPIPGISVLSAIQAGNRPFSDDGPEARVICGHYEVDEGAHHPLIEQLPEVIITRDMSRNDNSLFEAILPRLAAETSTPRPGNSAVVDRLAEILLIQVFRAHLAQRPEPTGFIRALDDPRLARAVRYIHEEFARRLSLEELAKVAGMSRSTFAEQFRTAANLSPIAYLTRWRLEKAREHLSRGDQTVGQVAHNVGYNSEVAFSRAFKREYGLSPASLRRRPS